MFIQAFSCFCNKVSSYEKNHAFTFVVTWCQAMSLFLLKHTVLGLS